MKLVIASLFATLLTVDASTRVAVLELGASGTVRRTTSSSEVTSVDGVASFWSALHGYGRKLQHAGMPMVPDLFSRPQSGVVIGLTGSGIDLDNMPTLESLLEGVEEKNENNVVGHMQVHGNQCKNMLKNVPDKQEYASGELKSAFDVQANQAGISGMHFDVSSDNAADFDAQLAALLKGYSSSETVIVHLVVEEEDGSARRRVLTSELEGKTSSATKEEPIQRRLAEDEGEGEGEGDGDGDGDENNNSGYYGYGYYNAYGEWVTPYKTMFQIQYFNVVLWTSLGLVATLFFSIYLMIYMPLMADTLLFGESARVAHDD